MDREEILEKSRKENTRRDEMERAVQVEGESFSLIFVFLVGLAILTYNRVHGLPRGQVLAMFWASCLGSRVYRLTKRKDISDLITGLISLAFLVFYLVRYFTQGR